MPGPPRPIANQCPAASLSQARVSASAGRGRPEREPSREQRATGPSAWRHDGGRQCPWGRQMTYQGHTSDWVNPLRQDRCNLSRGGRLQPVLGVGKAAQLSKNVRGRHEVPATSGPSWCVSHRGTVAQPSSTVEHSGHRVQAAGCTPPLRKTWDGHNVRQVPPTARQPHKRSRRVTPAAGRLSEGVQGKEVAWLVCHGLD